MTSNSTERGHQEGLDSRQPGQPSAELLTKNANVVPVLVVLGTHSPVFLFSRVPMVGEVVALDIATPTGGTRWRVVSVQHIPIPNGLCDVVAEIHCVEDPDFDEWQGQHPSQRK